MEVVLFFIHSTNFLLLGWINAQFDIALILVGLIFIRQDGWVEQIDKSRIDILIPDIIKGSRWNTASILNTLLACLEITPWQSTVVQLLLRNSPYADFNTIAVNSTAVHLVISSVAQLCCIRRVGVYHAGFHIYLKKSLDRSDLYQISFVVDIARSGNFKRC